MQLFTAKKRASPTGKQINNNNSNQNKKIPIIFLFSQKKL